MDYRYDFIVAGSGIAGLFYALQIIDAVPNAKIAILTKKAENETSTNRAQGGIAAALSGQDSRDAHVADTLNTGCGLCHRDVVKQVIEAGPQAIDELIKYGVEFTRINGELDLGREGGHSCNRVVHSSDLTGREIERALLAACHSHANSITLLRDHLVLDLVTYNVDGINTCAGVFVFSAPDKKLHTFYAPVTLLATGGLGMVYFHTSNPKIATGDGVAIAHRAGIAVSNMEFVQFHPTTLYSPGRWPFLISEAVRGEGARLYSVNGDHFMEDEHELKELAPRDIVARAIDRELKETGEEYVLLDVSHLDSDFVKKRFPNIYKECLHYGFDITQRPIPVVPSAHYACGGVLAKINGETSMPGLFAAGEVAMTGMHGANRLASNSLLEAVVMAKKAALSSQQYFENVDFPESVPVDNSLASSLHRPREKILVAHDRRELQRVMSDLVGIVRSVDRLKLALEKINRIYKAIEEFYMATPATTDIVELRNIATVSRLIIKSALQRNESRGLHYLEDNPVSHEELAHDTVIQGVERKI